MQDASLVLTQNPDEISQSWRNVLLGDVIKLTKKSKELRYADYKDIPFIPMEVIPIGRMFFEQFDLRSNTEISSGTYFEPGDILLAKITPSFENGKQGIIQKLPIGFGIATTEVIPINEIDGISDKYFLFYYLLRNGVRTELANKMDGSTGRQRLSVTALMSLKIALPSLREQRAIARILQTTQNAVQARRKELELEREHKATLMQHLFTHGTRGEATKQTAIGKIPQNWKITSLGEVCKIRYGLGQPPQIDAAGIPMIRATDIKNGYIVTNTVMKVKSEAIPVGRAYFLQKGDIIVVRSGVYAGDVAMYSGYWEKAIAGYDLVVTPTNNNVLSQFLTYYLQGEINQRYFRSQRDRSAQPHINADQLSNALIPLPFENGIVNKDEQEEISQLLSLCDSKIAALEKEIALQEELFRALLEELMSGRLSALPLVE